MLTRLPEEVLSLILDALIVPDLLNCRLLCSSIKAHIDGSAIIKYRIELSAAGMVDGTGCHFSAQERLTTLQRVQKAWSRLAWTEGPRVATAGEGTWDMHGSIYAQSIGKDAIEFEAFPSGARGRFGGYSWKTSLLEFGDFVLDTAQDLLVLVNVEPLSPLGTEHICVHFMAISTGRTHECAALPVLKVYVNATGQPYIFDFEVYGEFLGLISYGDDGFSRLSIWNWHTGVLLVGLSSIEELDSIFFVDKQHVILCCFPSRSDSILAFGPNSRHHPALHVVRFADIQGGALHHSQIDDLRIGVLLYPPVHDNTSTWCMTPYKNPTPSAPALGQEHAPFYVSHHERVCVIKMELESESADDEEVECLYLDHCIPDSLLVSHLARITGTPRDNGLPLIIPWSDWAMTSSRIILYTTSFSSVHMSRTYGSRYVTCSVQPGLDGLEMLRLTLYDFSQKGFRRGLFEKKRAVSPAEVDGWDYYGGRDTPYDASESEYIRHFFTCDPQLLLTDLPYRATTKLIDVPAGAVPERCVAMLAEDSIVICSENSDRSQVWMQTLTI